MQNPFRGQPVTPQPVRLEYEEVVSGPPLGLTSVKYGIFSAQKSEYVGELLVADAHHNADYFKEHSPASPLQENDLWLSNIRIKKPKHGYGLGAYVEVAAIAERSSLRFRSDPRLISREAKRVWESLVRRGLAVEEQPFHQAFEILDAYWTGGVYVYTGSAPADTDG